MTVNDLFTAVDNLLDLADAHVKFLRQRLIADAVYQPAFQDCPVSLMVYPVIYSRLNIPVAVVSDHRFLICPVPPHMLHFRYPLLVFLTRFLMVVLIFCFAIIVTAYNVAPEVVCSALPGILFDFLCQN